MKTVCLIFSVAALAAAQNYTARQVSEQGVSIVRLGRCGTWGGSIGDALHRQPRL
ncbi:MAG: hypothetical protein WDO73_28980 [Ignavibacteriota bacterium]